MLGCATPSRPRSAPLSSRWGSPPAPAPLHLPIPARLLPLPPPLFLLPPPLPSAHPLRPALSLSLSLSLSPSPRRASTLRSRLRSIRGRPDRADPRARPPHPIPRRPQPHPQPRHPHRNPPHRRPLARPSPRRPHRLGHPPSRSPRRAPQAHLRPERAPAREPVRLVGGDPGRRRPPEPDPRRGSVLPRARAAPIDGGVAVREFPRRRRPKERPTRPGTRPWPSTRAASSAIRPASTTSERNSSPPPATSPRRPPPPSATGWRSRSCSRCSRAQIPAPLAPAVDRLIASQRADGAFAREGEPDGDRGVRHATLVGGWALSEWIVAMRARGGRPSGAPPPDQ